PTRASLPFPPEHELGRADGERVAVAELGPLHPLPVDLGAVGRAEVDDPVRRALLAQLGVPPPPVPGGEPGLPGPRRAQPGPRAGCTIRVAIPNSPSARSSSTSRPTRGAVNSA